jgi:hypothetical protein
VVRRDRPRSRRDRAGSRRRAYDLERFLAEDAADYLAAGFTQFTLGVTGPDWELGSAIEEWLAWRDARRPSTPRRVHERSPHAFR